MLVDRLNLFYEEPNPDRWVPSDRHLRAFARRLVRGAARIGGQKRVFLNLCKGLDRIGIQYKTNDFRYAFRNPGEVVSIVGKAHLLSSKRWQNPIVLGPAVYSHPSEYPALLADYPNIRRIVVPGEWMRKMCEPYWGARVIAWPVGIDVDEWKSANETTTTDFVIYDKIRWEHETFESNLISPIRSILGERQLSFREIRYGFYREDEFRKLLNKCRAMIFLCEHETQGIAYQQALSAGVPILAWDRGGMWRDPAYYPDKALFGPVSAVPYWDGRCGVKFANLSDFTDALSHFLGRLRCNDFNPRDYVLENLTLEKCAQRYVEIVRGAMSP